MNLEVVELANCRNEGSHSRVFLDTQAGFGTDLKLLISIAGKELTISYANEQMVYFSGHYQFVQPDWNRRRS